MSVSKISSVLPLLTSVTLGAVAQPLSAPDTLSIKTSARSSVRRMQAQLAQAPVLKSMGTYVGELQEKWQFPSDHLPIAMTYKDVHIASWNVLSSDYMSWVLEKNSQGLSRSQIADEHVFIGNSKLTIRDQHVVRNILEMIQHPTHPRSLLSLQECSSAFIKELKSHLPQNMQMVVSGEDVLLVNRDLFEVVDAKAVAGVFTDAPKRTFQDVTLRKLDTQETIRILNAHLPGDATKPGRYQFAQYMADEFDPAVSMIAMGDMNFDELEMADAMRSAFAQNSPFKISSPYCTNVAPVSFVSKAIDHFFTYSPDGAAVRLDRPEEILDGLAPLVALLQ